MNHCGHVNFTPKATPVAIQTEYTALDSAQPVYVSSAVINPQNYNPWSVLLE